MQTSLAKIGNKDGFLGFLAAKHWINCQPQEIAYNGAGNGEKKKWKSGGKD